MEGWIKIHRQIEDHWIWENPKYIQAWIYCLFRANFKEKKVLLGSQINTIERGSFFTSRANFAASTNLSEQEVRTFWKLLVQDKMINQEGYKNATKITICNYEDYQTDQPACNQQATSVQPQRRKKEGKEKKKEIFKEKVDTGIELPYNSPKFNHVWTEWLVYKKQRRESYVPVGLKQTLTKLVRLSENNPGTAIKIIQQSMENGWAGLFELKDFSRKNGNAPSRIRKGGAPKPDGHFDHTEKTIINLNE